MFFVDNQSQFFRPLVSKYRAQAAECLMALYQRCYGAEADYGQAVERAQVVETFQEALVRAPLMADQQGGEEVMELSDDADSRFRDTREQANWLVNQLMDAGWLARMVDDATLQSTVGFTRAGRRFTEAFIDDKRRNQHRSRHRNTRNTRNALQSFLAHGEVYDLLDAYDYSERIISDFTDVIEELNERRRALVREMQNEFDVQRATTEFFEFMEQRFQPDIAIRLSADSVEKYREQISDVVRRIRRKPKDFKTDAEQRLRELLPDWVQPGRSVLWALLDGIEQRLKNAADVMLPALRRSLQHFTKRADIIIRQMNYMAMQKHADVAAVSRRLAALPAAEQNRRLDAVANLMARCQVGLMDPDQIRLQDRQRSAEVNHQLMTEPDGDLSARQAVYVQQALDQAFYISQQKLQGFIADRLANQERLSTADLPIETAEDFMAVAHLISAGQLEDWVVEPTGRRLHDTYFHQRDEFILSRRDIINSTPSTETP
ncbi:MAG: flagellar protein FliT [Natronospirillum sp.]